MHTLPTEYALIALVAVNLAARLARLLYSLLDSRLSGFRLEWLPIQPYIRVIFRIVSFLMGILMLYFTVVSLRKPLNILIYITIACESSLETSQAYAFMREYSPFAEAKSYIRDVGFFIVIFIVPFGLSFSPVLPIPGHYDFICFAMPVIVNFCGQAIFALMLLRQDIKQNWICMLNASRAVVFIALSLVVAVLCTTVVISPRQQRIISAAFLVAVTIVPTGFAAQSAKRKLSGWLRSASESLLLGSGSEINLNEMGTPKRPSSELPPPEPLSPPSSPRLPALWKPDYPHQQYNQALGGSLNFANKPKIGTKPLLENRLTGSEDHMGQ